MKPKKPNAIARLVPPGALKGYLGDRRPDERVTYATYFPKGKQYPVRSAKRGGQRMESKQ